MNFGEPIEYDDDDELDQVDDQVDDELDLGQAFRDFVSIGRLGLALAKGTRETRAEPGVIDMVEVAPGVFAPRPPARRARNPIERLERIEREFSRLKREVW